MRPVTGRAPGFAFFLALLFGSSIAAANPSPYLGLDLGHSRDGAELSFAATAGLRWPSGFGVAIDATPLDRTFFASWTGFDPQIRNYYESNHTYLGYAVRGDYRHEFGDHGWALISSLGWYWADFSADLPLTGLSGEFQRWNPRHNGAVAGIAVERSISKRWRASFGYRRYFRNETDLGFAVAHAHALHRLAFGLIREF